MYLHVHAKDFLNAYEVLKENNAALITRLGNPSGQTPASNTFGTRPTMGVEIVCLAFSVELHIKDLHYSISRKVVRGHDILSLFKALPEHIQRDVFSHPSISSYGWSFPNFEKEVQAISKGFEQWRYSYEVTTVRYNTYFALVFIEAVSAATQRAREIEGH